VGEDAVKPDSPDFKDLPETIMLQVNQLCDQYERERASGRQPKLDDYLKDLTPDARTPALRELILIDVEYRRQAGDHVTHDDYKHFFPDKDELLTALIPLDDTDDYNSKTNERVRQLSGRIRGDYEIQECIGAGGMGAVYKARHRRMDRPVAIKALLPEVSSMALGRFEREMRVAAKLTHPNIVTAYDAREEGGIRFLVMELIPGRDLSAILRADGPMKTMHAVSICLQAAVGLQYAHENGVIHRDVKPANLILDQNGVVKVLDLGLARLQSFIDADHLKNMVSRTGVIVGTPSYMAPEQAKDVRLADGRSDIYSLGAVFYHLLTGDPPFEGTSPLDTLMAHAFEPLKSLTKSRQHIEHATLVEPIIQKMLAKLPQDRFQTMQEVVQALEAIQRVIGDSRSTKNETVNAETIQAEVSRAKPGIRFIHPIAGAMMAILVLATVSWFAGPTIRPAPQPFALRFNGVDSYAYAPSLTHDPNIPLTLEAIVISRGMKAPANVISLLGPEWMALFIAGNMQWGIGRQNADNSQLLMSTQPAEIGRVIHVAGCWDGAALNLFVDGIRIESRPQRYALPATTSGLYIGGVDPTQLPPGENDRFFEGDVLQVRISRGVLYSSNFTAKRSLIPSKDTIALYQMDEGRGVVISDQSGGHHDATVINAEWVRLTPDAGN
jgi:tRNA A-37 threonylcarbamoyl transferase component Bud32